MGGYNLATLLVIISSLNLLSLCEGEDTQCQFHQYYQAVEDALINDTANLYKLQQLFFGSEDIRSYEPDKIGFTVCLASDKVKAIHFTNNLYTPAVTTPNSTQMCWRFVWSNSLFYGLITPGQLVVFESMFGVLLHEVIAIDHVTFGDVINNESTLYLQITTFSCDSLEENGFIKALIRVSSWLKAYARAHGKPATWNKEDVGYIAKWYSYWGIDGLDEYNAPHLIRISLLVTFILLNITVILITIGFVPQYYSNLTNILSQGSHRAASIYWASVIVAVTVNTCYILLYLDDCFKVTPNHDLHIHCGNPPYDKDKMASQYTKAVIMPISFLIELVVAICAPKMTDFPVPWRLTCCICQICCGCCSRSACSKVVQTLALWNILMFIQLTSMAAISVCLLLVYAPLRTISTLAIAVTILLSFTFVVASFIGLCIPSKAHGHRSWKQQCIHLLLLLVILMLINVVVVAYLIFQKSATTEGVSGVTLSLLPPIVLSAIGWYIKRKVFKGRTTNKYIPLARMHSVGTEQDSDSVEDVV